MLPGKTHLLPLVILCVLNYSHQIQVYPFMQITSVKMMGDPINRVRLRFERENMLTTRFYTSIHIGLLSRHYTIVAIVNKIFILNSYTDIKREKYLIVIKHFYFSLSILSEIESSEYFKDLFTDIWFTICFRW